MTGWKMVPFAMTFRGCVDAVLIIVAYPPDLYPDSPIRNDLHCVECLGAANGGRRYFGAKDTMIGSDLRMHVLPEGSACDGWEDSDPAVLGEKGTMNLYDTLEDRGSADFAEPEPANNDGRTSCFWCGSPTRKFGMGFGDVCTKCGR